MSSEVEFKGRTVAQAVETACQHLDIKEESLDYTVVSKGSTGIFGIVGAKRSKIKVFLKEKQSDRESTSQMNAGLPVAGEPNDPAPGTLSAAAQVGCKVLDKIVAGITEGARILTEENGGHISYDIITDGRAGILIGKRGQTLEAIQYLVEKVVNRKSEERLRVSIDVGGYQAKKRQKLENLAERTAQKAKKNGKPATLGQLNAHDRRIVHLALKSDGDVITKSVGNGLLRKLLVLPKRHSIRRNQRP